MVGLAVGDGGAFGFVEADVVVECDTVGDVAAGVHLCIEVKPIVVVVGGAGVDFVWCSAEACGGIVGLAVKDVDSVCLEKEEAGLRVMGDDVLEGDIGGVCDEDALDGEIGCRDVGAVDEG